MRIRSSPISFLKNMLIRNGPVCLLSAFVLWVAVQSGAMARNSYGEAQAMTYVRARDFRGLVQYAQVWTHAEPNNALAWYYLGAAYGAGLNDPKDSVAPLQRAVALKSTEMYNNALGAAYMQTGQYARAIAPMRRAVALDPRKPVYWNNLVAAYAGAYQFPAAIKALDRGVLASGPYAKTVNWYVFGNAYNRLREPAKAEMMYRKALARDPDFAAARNNLGAVQQTLGDYTAALASFRRAAALGDTLGTQNYRNLENAIAFAQAGSPARSQAGPVDVYGNYQRDKIRSYVANHPAASEGEARSAVSNGE